MRRVLIVVAVLLAGCGSSAASAGQAPDFPEFRSVCDHGNRLYFLPSYGAMAVASQDPTCAR